jgi:hypothetical protein
MRKIEVLYVLSYYDGIMEFIGCDEDDEIYHVYLDPDTDPVEDDGPWQYRAHRLASPNERILDPTDPYIPVSEDDLSFAGAKGLPTNE